MLRSRWRSVRWNRNRTLATGFERRKDCGSKLPRPARHRSDHSRPSSRTSAARTIPTEGLLRKPPALTRTATVGSASCPSRCGAPHRGGRSGQARSPRFWPAVRRAPCRGLRCGPSRRWSRVVARLVSSPRDNRERRLAWFPVVRCRYKENSARARERPFSHEMFDRNAQATGSRPGRTSSLTELGTSS